MAVLTKGQTWHGPKLARKRVRPSYQGFGFHLTALLETWRRGMVISSLMLHDHRNLKSLKKILGTGIPGLSSSCN
jgi:hypothetical protein